MKQLTIDPMFRDALPKLTGKEFTQLEENILADGEIREPLIIWKNTIVDGHNRYAIAEKHNLPFKVKQMEFVDQWDAISWMCRNQLGKRNLTENQKEYTLGKLYEARKNTFGNPDKTRDKRGRYYSHQSGENHHFGDSKNKTRDLIAEEQGVSPNKVKAAYEFSRSVDAAEELTPGFKDKVLSDDRNRGAIRSMIRMDDEERKEAAESIMRGEYVAEKKAPSIKKPESTEPYNAEDFRMEIAQFPRNLKTSIQMTLTAHGDMLSNEECKKDFTKMLNDVIWVAMNFKEEITNA